MFCSNIKVKDLIAELKETEVDIALPIPNSTYVSWLNSLQQLIYSEIIKEQRKKTFTPPDSNPILVSKLKESDDPDHPSDQADPRFEDIRAIYADGVQLIKTTLASGAIFPKAYYKDNNNIGYSLKTVPTEMTVVYIVRPALIEVDSDDYIIGDSCVMIPSEFIDLVKAKLRGEAYKLANEDGIAAKWISDYNVLLEAFKSWIVEKAPIFGL